MGEVVVLPGIDRRDLCGPPLPGEEVLRSALSQRIDDVIVLGRRPDGSAYVASSFNDADKIIGVLMSGVTYFTGPGFTQGISDYDEEPMEPA